VENLLTIKEIARRLGLAESTARYFRDKWPEFMPAVQHGRRTLYRPEALKVFKIIAEETQKRRSAEEIAERLSPLFAVNIESKRSNAEENAAEQQQHNYSLTIYEQQIYSLLEIIKERDQAVQRRDELMLYLVKQLRETQAQLEQARLPWWRKIL